jgi:hypothetical protein
MSSFLPNARSNRIGILFLVVAVALLLLEVWGIRASLDALF